MRGGPRKRPCSRRAAESWQTLISARAELHRGAYHVLGDVLSREFPCLLEDTNIKVCASPRHGCIIMTAVNKAIWKNPQCKDAQYDGVACGVVLNHYAGELRTNYRTIAVAI